MFEFLKKRILKALREHLPDYVHYETVIHNVKLGKYVKLYNPVRLFDSSIGDYSYVGMYSHFKFVDIGKFCSIGPHCFFGWGIHPVKGISTSPMFYSTGRQNGITLSSVNKVVEQEKIVIGNDVFIGMNVTILDGVSIGDGAVIGAGAIVSKNIPPYAIAVGNPVRILKYRFSEDIIGDLLALKWWDYSLEDLRAVEEDFFQVEKFISKMKGKADDKKFDKKVRD